MVGVLGASTGVSTGVGAGAGAGQARGLLQGQSQGQSQGLARAAGQVQVRPLASWWAGSRPGPGGLPPPYRGAETSSLPPLTPPAKPPGASVGQRTQQKGGSPLGV